MFFVYKFFASLGNIYCSLINHVITITNIISILIKKELNLFINKKTIRKIKENIKFNKKSILNKLYSIYYIFLINFI